MREPKGKRIGLSANLKRKDKIRIKRGFNWSTYLIKSAEVHDKNVYLTVKPIST